MRLLFVDLSSLFHPQWHTAPLYACEATVATIRKLAGRFDRLAVACDSDTSFRKAISADYKANRKPKEEAFVASMQRCRETLTADGFTLWQADGFEADDIIASAIEWWLSQSDIGVGSDTVTIASNDKDLAVLVGPRVSQMTPKETLDEAGVLAKYGVKPSQMTAYLSLVGDTSDGVKGAKGVGPTHAARLLGQFGDLTGIARAAMVESGDGMVTPPSIRKAILECGVDIELARQLVTLRRDVPGIDWAAALRPLEQAAEPSTQSAPEAYEVDLAEADARHAEAAESCSQCGVVLPPGEAVVKHGKALCLVCVRDNIAKDDAARKARYVAPQQQRREGPPQTREERHQVSNQQPGNQQHNGNGGNGNSVGPKVERANAIRQMFRARAKELAALFPQDGMAMVARAVSTACGVSMSLELNVSAESIAEAALACHHLGLDVGDQAYIYPFKGKAKLTVGPRGLIALAYRSGFVRSIEARSVFRADVEAGLFDYDFGKSMLTHRKATAGRRNGSAEKEIMYAYVIIETTTDGRILEVLTAEDLAFYRSFSKAGSGPWYDNYEGMARKTAIKRGLEFVPRSPLLSAALTETEDGTYAMPADLAAIVDKAIRARDGKAPEKEAPRQAEPEQEYESVYVGGDAQESGAT